MKTNLLQEGYKFYMFKDNDENLKGIYQIETSSKNIPLSLIETDLSFSLGLRHIYHVLRQNPSNSYKLVVSYHLTSQQYITEILSKNIQERPEYQSFFQTKKSNLFESLLELNDMLKTIQLERNSKINRLNELISYLNNDQIDDVIGYIENSITKVIPEEKIKSKRKTK